MQIEVEDKTGIVMSYCPTHRSVTLQPTADLISVIEDTGDLPEKFKDDCLEALRSWVHLIFLRHGVGDG